ISIHLNKEKENEEIRFQRNLERRKKLQELLEKKEQAEIPKSEGGELETNQTDMKFDQKPKIKSLPTVNEQEIKDKDALIGAMEALDEEMKGSQIDAVQSDKKSEELEFDEVLELDDEERDLTDLIPEKILNYHEKYSLMNGGLVQYDKLKEYVSQELSDVTDEFPEELFKQIINQLKELQMIQNIIKTAEYEFLLFNDIKLNFLHRRFLTHAIDKVPLQKEDFMKGLNWDEEKVLKTMKELQEMGIMRIENEKILLPGLIQKE
ncbi:MAG: hypothetical protein ACFFAT_16435, partial [Promethearchaeota archaeon]